MKAKVLMVSALVVLMAGCSSSSQPHAPETSQGRPETKTLEGASAVGYDGKAIRNSVDNTLNKNDQHNEDLDKEVKSGADGQPKQ
ncbi:hypothetical protein L4X63_17500 [Geomonas sp. Red32]|uniref:hypothetical protein n=1 Tax=Geomonas sp. Red32 TaxID=2912856 RepID=UPI00202CD493|nr:hypothetical protein [Geomonas sp. Red32]MCM0083383.1 hypothetical protein [Geomonas sp. Red32]